MHDKGELDIMPTFPPHSLFMFVYFQLDTAYDNVTKEIHKLDHRGDSAYEDVRVIFDEVIKAVEKRREEVLLDVKRKKDEKKKVLEEQLKIIAAEKVEVDSDVEKMKHQVEVRNITKKISELNNKLDAVNQLSEPRENSYMVFTRNENTDYSEHIRNALKNVGSVKTSKTFPSLCRATLETVICNIQTVARVQTIDYNGLAQCLGGDPVIAEVLDETGKVVESRVEDNEDGTYRVSFTTKSVGTHCLKISIFDRPIKDCPLYFDVTEHNSPVLSFGLQLQLGYNKIPQLDGSSDLVIFCDFCNKEFVGNKRGRDRETHHINIHLRSRFEEITPIKSENYFKCNKSECEFKATKKLDFWRHVGGKHGLTKLFIQQHFDKNPPLIPANGHYNGEDKETDQIGPREEQGALHANPSTSSLGPESGSYDKISAPRVNTNFSVSKPGPRPLAAFPVLTEYSEENETSAYSRAPTPSHQMGQMPMFPASHSTSALSGPPTLSAEAAPGLASLRYKLTSLPSVPSLQRETSLVSMASGQTDLSRQVSTPCLQPQETDMRSLRSNMSDPAFSQVRWNQFH